MGSKKKKRNISFKEQLKENKILLLGVSGTIIMLLFASFGARSDFFRTRRESKPVPDELTKSLSPTPTNILQESGECIVTGCSGQVCAKEEVVTTCEYKEIYSCFKSATCKIQSNGECGWTMDEELSSCLQSYVGEPSI